MSCTRPEERQANQSGGALANVVPANPDLQAVITRCNNLAEEDRSNIPDINNIRDSEGRGLDQLPHCPPTKMQLQLSTLFLLFLEQAGDCYRSAVSFVPNRISLHRSYEFVSVCCYSFTYPG